MSTSKQQKSLKHTKNDKASHSNIIIIIIIAQIAQQTSDERETAFLFQRLSVLVQRFNCVLLHDSFVDDDCPD